MRKKLLSKIVTCSLVGTFLLQNVTTVSAATYGEGLLPTNESVFQEHIDENAEPCTGDLPASVDLSTSTYFPAIRSQGLLGSCSPFSIVYYQFSYEANKLNNISSKTLDNCYSPKWAYNALNKGTTGGVSVENVYKFLQEHGSLKWNDFAYDASDYTSLPTDVAKMRAALNTRATGWETFEVNGTGTCITSKTDSDLDSVKNALAQGHPLQISTHNNWGMMTSSTWGKIAVRCGYKNSGHSMMVVGYNDNVWVDVNGNGACDKGEYGAFKIANSWGTSGTNTNSGFMWVLYDALNGKSSISGTWESKYSSSREPAFGFFTTHNYFNQLKVKNKKVNYVAEVKFTADKLNQLTVSVGKSNKAYSSSSTNYVADNFDYSKAASHTGTMVYDLNTVMSSLYNEYTGYKWYLKIGDKTADSSYVRNVSYKVTDNLGNTIKNGGSISSINGTTKNFAAEINLKKGDMDYSGTIELADAQTILKGALKTVELSNVQTFIADYNNDGSVTNADAQKVLNIALGIK